MGFLVFLIIFIVCIIAGFNGMPLLLLFPAVSIILFVIVLFSSKNDTVDVNTKAIKKENDIDEDIEDFIIYDMIDKK